MIPATAVFLLIAAGVFMIWTPAETTARKNIPVEDKQEGESRPEPVSGRYFRRLEKPEAYMLFYGWRDHRDRAYSVDFSMSKRMLRKAVDEFGYHQEELDAYVEEHLQIMRREMIVHLKKITLEEMSRSRYGQYFILEAESEDEFHFRLSIPGSDRDKYKNIRGEFVRITKKIAAEQTRYFKRVDSEKKKLMREFLESRLMRYADNKISVHYQRCVEKNSPRMGGVLEKIRQSRPGLSHYEFLAVILGFIQEIRYGIPPLEKDGRKILEFWVPPLVLIQYLGDCDSKGVAFASMWTHFKNYPIILIKIPQHLFVGIGLPVFNGEILVVNGLRYSLCEVTGPDRLPPGRITPYSRSFLNIGRYRYELIH